MRARALGVYEEQEVTFTVTGAGRQTPQSLEKLGVRGIIETVSARMAAGGVITLMDFQLYDGSQVSDAAFIAARPAAEDVAYCWDNLVPTASATEWALNDNVIVDGGKGYRIAGAAGLPPNDGDLKIGINVDTVSGAGVSTVILKVGAYVQTSVPAD